NLLQTVTKHVTVAEKEIPAQYIDQGEIKVVIEKKPEKFLTVILFTTVYDLDIRKRLRYFLDEFSARFGDELGRWFGDASKFGAAIELVPLAFGKRLPPEMWKLK
ncbi:MAG: hypothetical protein ACFFCQ_18330, partial [Promethearchaeota archaeon]